MSPTHYKLYYFDFRGLGEPIRAIRTNGKKFEEERIKFEDWDKHKSLVSSTDMFEWVHQWIGKW